MVLPVQLLNYRVYIYFTTANYFTHTAAEQLQTITINDYTFVCNRNVKCAYTNAVSITPPNEGIIELKVAYGRKYRIDLIAADGTEITDEDGIYIETSADADIILKLTVFLKVQQKVQEMVLSLVLMLRLV